MDRLAQLEAQAFATWHPPGTLHRAVDSPEDAAVVSGILRQRNMMLEYAKRKAAGEFPDGPEVRGLTGA